MKNAMYVSRDVINGEDIVKWAKDAGFSKTITPDKMHVTISYSKKPVDFRRVNRQNNKVTIEGGKRTIEQFDGGAVVLRFESNVLSERWQDMIDIGASWDYDGYKPHVTLTFDSDADFDLSSIQAYTGPIILGPEKVEKLNLNWKDTIEEK